MFTRGRADLLFNCLGKTHSARDGQGNAQGSSGEGRAPALPVPLGSPSIPALKLQLPSLTFTEGLHCQCGHLGHGKGLQIRHGLSAPPSFLSPQLLPVIHALLRDCTETTQPSHGPVRHEESRTFSLSEGCVLQGACFRFRVSGFQQQDNKGKFAR